MTYLFCKSCVHRTASARAFLILGLLLFAVFAPLARGGQAPVNNDAARVTRLADEYVREYIARNPEAATFEGLPNAPDDKLSDNSLESLKAWRAREDDWLARLAAIDGASLWGRPEWLTYGFLREALEGSKGLRVARLELWPVNQMSGWQASLTQLASIQPVGSTAARERTLARFRQVPRSLDTEVLNLKEGLRLGYSTPKPNVELTLAQLDALLQAPVRESPFFSPAKRDGDAGFKAEWERLLTAEITPAVQRYRDYLKDEYLPKARTTIALSALPNGAEAYRALLRAFTTLDRTAEETSRLGEQAVARYEAEAADIGRKLFGAKDLKAVLKKLERDPRSRFKTREELLEFSKAAVDRARRALPQWVEFMPKAEVVIEPIPAYLEKTASSAYQSGAVDGSRPGVYLINLYQPENQTRANAELTAFHETYPGHHFQISVSAELPRPHLITRLVASGGYIEGWARYAEAWPRKWVSTRRTSPALIVAYGPPTAWSSTPGFTSLAGRKSRRSHLSGRRVASVRTKRNPWSIGSSPGPPSSRPMTRARSNSSPSGKRPRRRWARNSISGPSTPRSSGTGP